MEQPTKRFLRSTTNRVVAGVCGGIAEYWNLDVTLVRVIVVLLTLWKGWLIPVYILLWLIIPEQDASMTRDDRVHQVGQEMSDAARRAETVVRQKIGNGTAARNFVGGGLILVGLIVLAKQYLPWDIVRWDILWPIVIIFVGILLMIRKNV